MYAAGADSTDMPVEKTLDIKGEVCPYTYVKTKLALMALRSGDTLAVIVDHRPAVDNVPRSAQLEGHSVVAVGQVSGTDWRIVIKKK